MIMNGGVALWSDLRLRLLDLYYFIDFYLFFKVTLTQKLSSDVYKNDAKDQLRKKFKFLGKYFCVEQFIPLRYLITRIYIFLYLEIIVSNPFLVPDASLRASTPALNLRPSEASERQRLDTFDE